MSVPDTNIRNNIVMGDLNELSHWSPLSILEMYGCILSPNDVRYDPLNPDESENENLKILSNSLDIHMIRKIPQLNAVEFGVYIMGSLKKHKYVYDQNQEINPEDTSVIQIKKQGTKDIITVTPDESGEQSNTMSLCATIRYSLEVKEDHFLLSYAIWDTQGKVLYYNKISGSTMYGLMIQATQEMFGNSCIENDSSGPYLEGIPRLLNGAKIKLCKDNHKPEWLDLKLKTSNPEKTTNSVLIILFKTLSILLGIIVPIAITIKGIIPAMAIGIGEYNFIGPDFKKILICIVLIFVSVYIGQYFKILSKRLKFLSNII